LDFGKVLLGTSKSLETKVHRGLFAGSFCVVLNDAPPFQFKMITAQVLSAAIGDREGTAQATVPATTAPGTYSRFAQVTIRSAQNTQVPCNDGQIIDSGTYSLKATVVRPLEPNPTAINFLNATPGVTTTKSFSVTANVLTITISKISVLQSGNVFQISPTTSTPLIDGQSKTFNATFNGASGSSAATIQIDYTAGISGTPQSLKLPLSANTAVPQTPTNPANTIDLVVDQVQATTQGSSLQVKVRTRNNGNAASPSCVGTIFLKNQSGTFVSQVPVSIPSVPAGGTADSQVTFPPTVHGSTQIKVQLDVQNRVPETNEGNNESQPQQIQAP
jgi:Uncharacterized conserved protein